MAETLRSHREPTPTELATVCTIGRFGLRLVIFAGFALVSQRPFWAVMATLLVLAALLSALVAGFRGERVFGPALTHWDEAAWYALLSRGAAILAVADMPGE